MTAHDLGVLQRAIEEKSILLLRHENKNFAKTGLDSSNYEEILIGKRTFYSVSTPVFSKILEDVLPEAVRKYTDHFGTGRAEDVVNALYKTEPWAKRENFGNFLGTEQFCYVFEVSDGQLNHRVLRIDLFRRIEEENGVSEFIGGIFHAFKHFSYEGMPLSTGKDKHDIKPHSIIFLLIKAFFIDPEIKISETSYQVISRWDDRYDIQYAFYYEPNTAVYFVKTAFKITHKPDSSGKTIA
jgi:hypothetical protein